MQGSASLFDEGRFGPVYRSRDPETDRPVLIRTFAQPLTPAEQGRLVEALTRLCESPLDHPSIARPLVAGVEDGRPFLVHTLLPGLSLRPFLQQHGPQPFADAVLRVTQLAAALDFAAAAGVHHGDLGAGDVILDTDATGISGLGVAQALEEAGIAAHASPTRAGDIRALGQLAFELLTGRAIDRADDAREMVVPDADAARLQAAFAAALSEEAEKRPSSALGFAAALQEAIVERDSRADMQPVADDAAPADIGAPALADLPLREPHEAPVRFAEVEPLLPVAAAAPPAFDGPALRESHSTPQAESSHVLRQPREAPGSVLLAASAPPREADASSNGWLLVTAALAVGILGGFTGGFIVGQRSDLPVPQFAADAMRSSQPEPAATSGADVRGSATSAERRNDSRPGVISTESGPVVAEPGITSRELETPAREQAGAAGTPAPSRDAAAGSPSSPGPPPAAPPSTAAASAGPGGNAEPRAPARSAQEPAPGSPDAAAARPDTPGGLQVLSRPEGAQVFVDGALVGRTPLLVGAMQPGTHDVRLELAGHRRWATRVRIEPGARARVAASLEQ